MKKLLLTSFGVFIVLVGFMAILYFLPCNGGGCCGDRDNCSVGGKHGGCKGEGHGCEGKSHGSCEGKGHGEMKGGCQKGHGSCEGKGHGEMKGGCQKGHGSCEGHGMRRELRIEMCGDGGCTSMHGKVDTACGGHGKMEGGMCMKPEMEMSCGPVMSGCCCCCPMMHGGMMEKNVRVIIDSTGRKDSVVIIRK